MFKMSLKKKNAFSVRFIGGPNIPDDNTNEWPTWPKMKINSVRKDKKPVTHFFFRLYEKLYNLISKFKFPDFLYH